VGKSATWNGCDTFLAGLAGMPDLEELLLSLRRGKAEVTLSRNPALVIVWASDAAV
jgi:hypothetical protein